LPSDTKGGDWEIRSDGFTPRYQDPRVALGGRRHKERATEQIIFRTRESFKVTKERRLCHGKKKKGKRRGHGGGGYTGRCK